MVKRKKSKNQHVHFVINIEELIAACMLKNNSKTASFSQLSDFADNILRNYYLKDDTVSIPLTADEIAKFARQYKYAFDVDFEKRTVSLKEKYDLSFLNETITMFVPIARLRVCGLTDEELSFEPREK